MNQKVVDFVAVLRFDFDDQACGFAFFGLVEILIESWTVLSVREERVLELGIVVLTDNGSVDIVVMVHYGN